MRIPEAQLQLSTDNTNITQVTNWLTKTMRDGDILTFTDADQTVAVNFSQLTAVHMSPAAPADSPPAGWLEVNVPWADLQVM